MNLVASLTLIKKKILVIILLLHFLSLMLGSVLVLMLLLLVCLTFFFNDTATTEIYTLSLHDALPISAGCRWRSQSKRERSWASKTASSPRSEEHTSELQSRSDLVCRLLLEKKKN